MEKFFKRKSVDSTIEQDSNPTTKIFDKRNRVDLNNLPLDTGLRPKICLCCYGNWLEYSKEKNATFCLCCYVFRTDINWQVGGDTFINGGFRTWNKKDRLEVHVGGQNNAHNLAWTKCINLMNQKQHIQSVFYKQSE